MNIDNNNVSFDLKNAYVQQTQARKKKNVDIYKS